MSLESGVKTAQDVVEKGARLVETGIKKAWSILEAAVEKQSPSQYLSPRAVNSIQGKTQG